MSDTRPTPSQPRGASPPPPAPSAQQTPLHSRFADDPVMRDILGPFVAELPTRVSEIRACWDRRDLDGLARHAHRLRGTADGYGFPEVARAADRLETSLRSIVDEGAA